MHTTTTSTHPTTQLDLVRNDAAARQRRAATYRFVHQQRPRSTRSATRGRSVLTALAAILLTVGVISGSPAASADTPALPHGYEAGCADGWYCPGDTGGTVSTAEDSLGPASTPLPHGYAPGHPDGWYVPGQPGVRTAGDVIDPSTNLVPNNVR